MTDTLAFIDFNGPSLTVTYRPNLGGYHFATHLPLTGLATTSFVDGPPPAPAGDGSLHWTTGAVAEFHKLVAILTPPPALNPALN